MVRAHARPELLASPEWLAANLERPEVRVLDLRWRPDGTGRAVWQAGHVPGAAWIDWSTELVEADPEVGSLLLPGPDRVAATLGQAGVADGTTVVIYDDAASLFATRAWWTLRAYGHDSARILDGGIGAWRAAGLPITGATPAPPPSVFTPRAQPRSRLDWSDVRSLLGARDVLLLDARPPAEFLGRQGDAARLGDIPGAVNVPSAATTKPSTGRFRDGDEIRHLLGRAIQPGLRRLVCYDGAGVGAAKLSFALALLGYEDVAVYEGGWSEWGERRELPVER